MDVTPLLPAGRQIIESYGGGGFRVSGRSIAGSILVFPDRATEWTVTDIAGLSVDSVADVVRAGAAGSVDLVLVGCGRRMGLIPTPVRQALRDAGIVAEAMDTGAACRTYNVLMADGRRVAAALIAIP
ncbi:MAG TPA: Mth938-like domain-containing protein [Methylomirabilota bacterium]|nr:Mth938-like domain-containing protein [Methylomirabilota bacterium]